MLVVILLVITVLIATTKISLHWPGRVVDIVTDAILWGDFILAFTGIIGWTGMEIRVKNAIDEAHKKAREESRRKVNEALEELEQQKAELDKQIEESNRRIEELKQQRERILNGG